MAENLLAINNPEKLWKELDEQIVKGIMSKTKKVGKTTKVGVFTAIDMGSGKKKNIGFPNPTSKIAKKMILQGKLKEVVNFHILRKHTTKYDFCLACKAIRAFIQYEFHLPMSEIKSGVAAGIIGFKKKDSALAAKAIEAEKELLNDIFNQPLVKSVEVITKKNPTHSSMCDCMDCYTSKNGPMGPVSEHDKDIPLMKSIGYNPSFKDEELFEKEANFLEDENDYGID